MEISGLPCGNFGVTVWKFRGYRVENSALPQAPIVAKLLAYVLHCLMVIDEFPATGPTQKGRSLTESNRIGVIEWRRRLCAEPRKMAPERFSKRKIF